MKFIIVITTIVLAVNAYEQALARSQWDAFKTAHKKAYTNSVEELSRFTVFRSNLQRIEEHNAKYEAGLVSWKMGVTPFADMTTEEFKAYLKTSGSFKKPSQVKSWTPKLGSVRADSFDWREQGAVSPVKNQGSCGSCWAFSATGALETQYYLENGNFSIFSEQALVDCSTSYGNAGCNGGWMDAAFTYIYYNGIPTEEEYPYEAVDGQCRYNGGGLTISNFYSLVGTGDENNLRLATEQAGTISVAIDASSNMQLYSSGLFDDSLCSSSIDDLNHGVVVVGFDSEDGFDYWIVKNSWGSSWGEDGYIRMARNRDNQCGIANYGFFPAL